MTEYKISRLIRKKLNKLAFRRASGWNSPGVVEFYEEQLNVYNIFLILIENGLTDAIAIEVLQANYTEPVTKNAQLRHKLNILLGVH
jgi:hypothetical protein